MLFDNLAIRSLPAAEIVMGSELLNWGGEQMTDIIDICYGLRK